MPKARNMSAERKIMMIAAIVVLMISSASCTKYDQELNLGDVTKEQVVVLTKMRRGNVTKLAIHGYGHLNGRGTISLLEGGNPVRTAELQNEVDFKFGGDWYSDTADLRYEPRDVQAGDLVIEYVFETLD